MAIWFWNIGTTYPSTFTPKASLTSAPFTSAAFFICGTYRRSRPSFTICEATAMLTSATSMSHGARPASACALILV
jgi:hypothetical protein